RAVERLGVGGGRRFRAGPRPGRQRELQTGLQRSDCREHLVRVGGSPAVDEEHAIGSGRDGNVAARAADEKDMSANRDRIDGWSLGTKRNNENNSERRTRRNRRNYFS